MLGWPDLRILPFAWQPENRNQNLEYYPAMKHLAIAEVQLCSTAVSLSKMHKFCITDAVPGGIAFRLLQSLKQLWHYPFSAMSWDASLSSPEKESVCQDSPPKGHKKWERDRRLPTGLLIRRFPAFPFFLIAGSHLSGGLYISAKLLICRASAWVSCIKFWSE